jgi:hypothetical protein
MKKILIVFLILVFSSVIVEAQFSKPGGSGTSWNWADSSSYGPDSVSWSATSGSGGAPWNWSDSSSYGPDSVAWAAVAGSGGGTGWNWSDSSSHGPDSVLYADTSIYALNDHPLPDSGHWSNAYTWGNHASAGYLTKITTWSNIQAGSSQPSNAYILSYVSSGDSFLWVQDQTGSPGSGSADTIELWNDANSESHYAHDSKVRVRWGNGIDAAWDTGDTTLTILADEGELALSSIGGAVTDVQVPNTITINYADSAGKFTWDGIKDYHIDWGTGANQVSTDDMTQGSTNKYDQPLPDSSNWSTAYYTYTHIGQTVDTTEIITAQFDQYVKNHQAAGGGTTNADSIVHIPVEDTLGNIGDGYSLAFNQTNGDLEWESFFLVPVTAPTDNYVLKIDTDANPDTFYWSPDETGGTPGVAIHDSLNAHWVAFTTSAAEIEDSLDGYWTSTVTGKAIQDSIYIRGGKMIQDSTYIRGGKMVQDSMLTLRPLWKGNIHDSLNANWTVFTATGFGATIDTVPTEITDAQFNQYVKNHESDAAHDNFSELSGTVSDAQVPDNITISGLTDSTKWNDAVDTVLAWDNRGYPQATTTLLGIASFATANFSVTTGAVSIKADGINDTHIDWGTGANQVSTDDMMQGSTNKYDQPLPDSSNWSTAYYTYTHIGQTVDTTEIVTAQFDQYVKNHQTAGVGGSTNADSIKHISVEDTTGNIGDAYSLVFDQTNGDLEWEAFFLVPVTAPTDNYVLKIDTDADPDTFYWAADETGGTPGAAINDSIIYGYQIYQKIDTTSAKIPTATLADSCVKYDTVNSITWSELRTEIKNGAEIFNKIDTTFKVDCAYDSVVSWGNTVNVGYDSVVSWGNTVNVAYDSVTAWGNKINTTYYTYTNIGQTVESSEITNQTIVKADIDTTSTFIFGEIYHKTSGFGDSVYVTKNYVGAGFQPLEATLTDIADGTIAENLVNTANPWADNEVANDITVSNYLPLAGGTMADVINMGDKDIYNTEGLDFDTAYVNGDVIADFTGSNLSVSSGALGVTLLKDLVTTAPLTGGTDDILVGADADVTLGITVAKDLVTTAPLAGGTDDILPGADADITLSITAQGISKVQIDSTSSNFAFDGAYHITTGIGDSAYVSRKEVRSRSQSKGFVILSATTDNDFIFWKLPVAITIDSVFAKCKDGTNVVGALDEYDYAGASVSAVVDGDWTVTTTQYVDGSFTNAGLDAGDWLGWHTTSVSGTVTVFSLTFWYHE